LINDVLSSQLNAERAAAAAEEDAQAAAAMTPELKRKLPVASRP